MAIKEAVSKDKIDDFGYIKNSVKCNVQNRISFYLLRADLYAKNHAEYLNP